jgi:RimJ/RimL family protein N-acetyltransferase
MSTHSLRDLKPTDAIWIFEACQDEQIQYWTTVPKPYLMEHAVGFANGKTSEKKVWVIEDSSKKEVGVISIHGVDENGNAEIGYWVAVWGRGVGATKDAIISLAEYAKTQSDIKSIQATISDLNIASQAVAIAAGLARAEAAAKTCPAGGVETTATYYRKAL